MTEVLILHRIPGARVGAIVPLDERMEQHVAAGNAKILPNAHEPWNDDERPEPQAPPVHLSTSTGSAPALSLVDHDDDTEDDPED